jgi:hypothetical protein
MTNVSDSLEPHRHTLDLACDPERAFDVFTFGMGDWWDPAYTPDAATFSGIVVEPYVGGTVATQHGEEQFPFGEVTAWEPGVRFAQTFTLAMDRSHPSELEVRFEAVGDGCRVMLEHGGWTHDNADYREKYGDWPHLLAGFESAVTEA